MLATLHQTMGKTHRHHYCAPTPKGSKAALGMCEHLSNELRLCFSTYCWNFNRLIYLCCLLTVSLSQPLWFEYYLPIGFCLEFSSICSFSLASKKINYPMPRFSHESFFPDVGMKPEPIFCCTFTVFQL